MKKINLLNLFIKKLQNTFDFNVDSKVKSIMEFGIKFNFVLVLISTLVFSIYITTNRDFELYNIGAILLKSGSMFIVFFIIFGICFNQILKEKNQLP